MATFFKRKHKKGWNYFVQVRRKGIKTFCKTFATRTEAKRWARQMETKLDWGDFWGIWKQNAPLIQFFYIPQQIVLKQKHEEQVNGILA